MKKALLMLIVPLSLLSVQRGDAQRSKLGDGRTELIAVDSMFNFACQTVGFRKSFIEFAAEDVIMMRQEQHPIIGKDSLRMKYSEIKNEPRLSWSPVYSEIAASGDLGYTFGRWKRVGPSSSGADTAYYGVYVSIWKKQKDGSWKYVFDGGNDTPGPLPWDIK